MNTKDIGPEIPSQQDLVAFAKEYFKSYNEAIEEKKPSTYPRFSQEAPYLIRCFLLPNGCICMIFTSSQELKVEGGSKTWEEVQEIVVKGVDHFAGFFPFEGRSLGDWNKRGKRDAHRDVRLMDKSELAKASAELDTVMDGINKWGKTNIWYKKTCDEMVATLRGMENRVKGGFPTVDAIAMLQSMKAYVPGGETVTIEFPEKELLENISEAIKNLSGLEGKLEALENRLFEVEKASSSPEYSGKVTDALDRIDRLEKQLEKVSNILTMLNSKVESYFSKTAEKERQADLEKRIEDYSTKAMSHDAKISELEKEAEKLVEEMRKMTAKMDKDIHDSRKRIARLEKHFVDFGKLMQD